MDREFEVFERFNESLKDAKIDITVICVGGFVLSHYGMRTTQDVDGFYRTSERIEKIIKEVGDEFGINTPDELWLNNSVQNLNEKPREEVCNVLYEFSNLKVLMPPLDYVAGMKLRSARNIDIMDVGEIIRKEGIDSPAEFKKQLEAYGFTSVDESLLLEAFCNAYGMEWLESYFVEHMDELVNNPPLNC